MHLDTPQTPDGDLVSLSDLLTRRQRARFKTGDVLLERYKILDELGQGGMGLVYRGLDQVGGVGVALKMLPPEVAHDTGEMEEVRANFRIVHKLQHPNIAVLHTLERHEATGDYLLVMELVEGVNLRVWRKQNFPSAGTHRPSLAILLPMLRQIAAALDYAHSQKIIHRDIKPANVMIAADGAVKVLDFGLATQIQSSFSRISHMQYSTSGTRPYMAPEQWRGQRQDGRTDQYALAVLVYELLQGRRPFENAEMNVLREAVLNDTPEQPAGLSNVTWSVLLRALAKEREQRFATCSEFVEALAVGRGGRVPSHVSGRSGGLGKLAMVVGILLALVLFGWWGSGPWQRRQEQQAHVRAQKEAMKLEEREKAAAELRAQAEQLLTSGDFKGVGDKLAELRSLGAPGSASAVQLDDKLGELETKSCYNEAALAYEAARKLTRDEARGVKLDELELKWREAEAARESRTWGQALKAYDNVLTLAKNLTDGYAILVEADGHGSETKHMTLTEQDKRRPGVTMQVNLGNGVMLDLVWIPAGRFLMGSPFTEGFRESDEGPQHQVTISSGFWMGKTEVTQRQFAHLMGSNPSHFKYVGPNAPADNVTWNQAKTFCERLQARLPAELHSKTARLPTEAEWEYACRAGSEGTYAGELNNLGWYELNSGTQVKLVGQKQPNAWGLYDMHGNVLEWCWDEKRVYTESGVTDPEGAGSSRVARGGGWGSHAQGCRSAERGVDDPSLFFGTVGFRVVVR